MHETSAGLLLIMSVVTLVTIPATVNLVTIQTVSAEAVLRLVARGMKTMKINGTTVWSACSTTCDEGTKERLHITCNDIKRCDLCKNPDKIEKETAACMDKVCPERVFCTPPPADPHGDWNPACLEPNLPLGTTCDITCRVGSSLVNQTNHVTCDVADHMSTVGMFVPEVMPKCEPDCDAALRFFVGSNDGRAFEVNSTGSVTELSISAPDMIFTAADHDRKLVFFTTESYKSVFVYNFTSNQDELVANGMGANTRGIGLDTVHELVFVSCDALGIWHMTYEGKNVTQIIAANLPSTGITTDSENRILYFTNRDNGKVEMVNYTNLNAPGPRQILVNGLTSDPRGIWLEKEANLLYFILTDGRIYEVPLSDPNQSKTITGTYGGSARGLVKCRNTFFFSDVDGKKIWKVTPSLGNERVKVNGAGVGSPYGFSLL